MDVSRARLSLLCDTYRIPALIASVRIAPYNNTIVECCYMMQVVAPPNTEQRRRQHCRCYTVLGGIGQLHCLYTGQH
jgi:hypothetical protein